MKRQQKLRDRLKDELPSNINKGLFIKGVGRDNPILNDREHTLSYFCKLMLDMELSQEAKEFWAYLYKYTTEQKEIKYKNLNK